jgi:O-antigen ligase
MNIKSNNLILYILILLPIFLVISRFAADLSVVILGIFFILKFIKNKKLFRELSLNNNFLLIFSIFFFYIVLRSFFSEFMLLSLRASFFYIRFFLLSLAIYYFLTVEREIIIKKFYFFLKITLLFVILSQFIELFYNYYKNIRTVRLSGLFLKEKILGSYIIKILPLFLYFFFYRKIKFFNLVVVYILALISILFSGERTALFLFIMYFILLNLSLNIKYKLYLYLAFLLIIISFFIASPMYFQRIIIDTYLDFIKIENTINNFYFFSEGNEMIYYTSLKMFFDNIFFGQGPGLYRYLCSNEIFYINNLSCSTHSHNYYLQLLAETGLLGFSFLVIFYTYLIFIYFKFIFFKLKEKKIIFNNSQICLLLGFIINLFPLSQTGNFFNNWICITIFLPLGFFIYEFKLLKK